MRLLLLAVALVAVSGAAGSSGVKTIGTRAKVVSISADGGSVAIHAGSGVARVGCNFGSVWTPATGKVVRFTDYPCGSKSQFDLQYDALTLAGSRVVWTDFDFGNHAYCHGPFTATFAKASPQDLGGCPDEPGDEDMFWEYRGDGGLLVGRSYFQCDYSCPPDYVGTYQDEIVIWSIGAKAKKLVTAKRNTALLDVDAGRILLRDPAKKLLVLNGAGKQVAALAVDAKAAWLDGSGRVSVPAGTTLRTYDAATGAVVETCMLKTGANVQDVENGLAVYLTPGEVHLLTIATNADRVVARQKGLVQADLEPGGVFYAYNVPGGGSKPGRVTFVPLK